MRVYKINIYPSADEKRYCIHVFRSAGQNAGVHMKVPILFATPPTALTTFADGQD